MKDMKKMMDDKTKIFIFHSILPNQKALLLPQKYLR